MCLRIPARILESFKYGLLAEHFFWDQDAANADVKSSTRKQVGEKWKVGFKERCHELGKAPLSMFWMLKQGLKLYPDIHHTDNIVS